jgi:hypothetical protein
VNILPDSFKTGLIVAAHAIDSRKQLSAKSSATSLAFLFRKPLLPEHPGCAAEFLFQSLAKSK